MEQDDQEDQQYRHDSEHISAMNNDFADGDTSKTEQLQQFMERKSRAHLSYYMEKLLKCIISKAVSFKIYQARSLRLVITH